MDDSELIERMKQIADAPGDEKLWADVQAFRKRTTINKEDHEVIYLQPKCCEDPSVGRLWCEDDVFSEQCENGNKPTKYVRAKGENEKVSDED